MNYLEQIALARSRGCPLLIVTTADPSDTITQTQKALNGKLSEQPIMIWDCIRGLNGLNDVGQKIAADLNQGQDPASITGNVVEALRTLANTPEKTFCFMQNAQAWLQDSIPAQAVWNLRDSWKAAGSTLVMLATQGTKPPASLKDDVISIDAALPDINTLEAIVGSLTADAGIKDLSKKALKTATDATLGLSAFGAEQALAMSITKTGIDNDILWDKKRKQIENTRGLECYKGRETFADIGGNQNLIDFFRKLINGPCKPRCIMFVDEIEKAMAGTKGDTSGTSQGTHGELLKWTADNNVPGVLLLGPPGSGKSAVCKALAGESKTPLIQFDLKGMEDSLVGASLQNLKAGLATVDAIGQGEILLIATCNSFGDLSPELKRRFTLGKFFCDLPTDEERAKIWEIYCKKYSIKQADIPACNGWTGAEIKQACEIARRLQVSLQEAADFVIPIAKSAAESIKRLRLESSGNFISASYKGAYVYNQGPQQATGRKITQD